MEISVKIVPPQKPKILNERGEIIQTLAGPYDEGSDIVLLCEVRDGSPQPKINWLWNGKHIDSTMLDFSFASIQTSKLAIKNLSRIHQHTIITCRASNFPKTETTANVTIDLLCKYILYFICDLVPLFGFNLLIILFFFGTKRHELVIVQHILLFKSIDYNDMLSISL